MLSKNSMLKCHLILELILVGTLYEIILMVDGNRTSAYTHLSLSIIAWRGFLQFFYYYT